MPRSRKSSAKSKKSEPAEIEPAATIDSNLQQPRKADRKTDRLETLAAKIEALRESIYGGMPGDAMDNVKKAAKEIAADIRKLKE